MKSLLLVLVTTAALGGGGALLVLTSDDDGSGGGATAVESSDQPTSTIEVDSATTSTTSTSTTTDTSTTTLPAVVVPDVTGLSFPNAQQELRRGGLEAVVTQVDATTAEEIGTVVGQSIAGGNRVDRGTAIDVTFAVQPLPATAPSPVIDYANVDSYEANPTLELGACFNASVTNRQLEFIPISCDLAHDYQLADTPVVEFSGAYDPSSIEDEVIDKCREALTEFTGAPQSALSLRFVYPGETAWVNGDRLAFCFVTPSEDGLQFTATAEGALW